MDGAVRTVQVITCGWYDKFAVKLANAVTTQQNEGYDVEIQYTTTRGEFTALVIARNKVTPSSSLLGTQTGTGTTTPTAGGTTPTSPTGTTGGTNILSGNTVSPVLVVAPSVDVGLIGGIVVKV